VAAAAANGRSGLTSLAILAFAWSRRARSSSVLTSSSSAAIDPGLAWPLLADLYPLCLGGGGRVVLLPLEFPWRCDDVDVDGCHGTLGVRMCHNLHSDFFGILPVACSLRTHTSGWKHPHVVSKQSFPFLYWTQ
jgi:hypothetical protein